MLIEEFEEEIKRKKRRKKVVLMIIGIICTGFAIVLLYDRFFNGNTVVNNGESDRREEIMVFYPAEGLRLNKKILNIQKNLHEKTRIELAIKSLKAVKVIPEGLVLYEYAVDEKGTLYANFSKHLIDETKEPKREITTVFSLVNTLLSNVSNAKAVQFLIEGQPVHTLNGIVYTYNPIPFNDSLTEE